MSLSKGAFHTFFFSYESTAWFLEKGAKHANTKSEHKSSKSIGAEIHLSNTIFPGKRPSMTILASEN